MTSAGSRSAQFLPKSRRYEGARRSGLCGIRACRAQQANKLYTFSHNRKGARLASTSSLYVYDFSPPTCESQYVVGSVKNSPCLQRLRIASSIDFDAEARPRDPGGCNRLHAPGKAPRAIPPGRRLRRSRWTP